MKDYLRMKDLVDRTGINKSTILHYLSLGLLPDPIRSSKNMSYYPQCYLNILPVIRTMQTTYHLPLQVIKQILDNIRPEDISIGEVKHVYETFYLVEKEVPEEYKGIFSREEFLAYTGLTEDELKNLEKFDMIIPLKKDVYNSDDLLMVNSYRKLSSNNIELDAIKPVINLLRLLADETHRIYHQAVQGRNKEEEWEITHSLYDYMKTTHLYLVRRLLHQIFMDDNVAR